MLQILREAGAVTNHQVQMRRKSGEILHLLMSAELITLSDQPYLLTMVVDITAHKQAEDSLRESEARFSAIFEFSPLGIALSRLSDGAILNINPAWERLTGTSKEEAIGHNSLELNSWVDPVERMRMVQILKETGELNNHEAQMRHKSGDVLHLLMSAKVIDLANEKYMVSMIVDVTASQQAEQARRASEAKFRAIVENSHDGIVFVDANSIVQYRSPSYYHINGYSDGERLGHDAFEVIHPDDVADQQGIWDWVLHHPGETRTTVYRSRHQAGHWLWFESTLNNLLADPDVQAVIVTSRDITARKQAEEELKKRLEELNRWYKATLGRESRIIEMKREINELLQQAGKPARYQNVEIE